MIVEEGFWTRVVRRIFAPRRSEPPPVRREELVEALANVDRQLEILKGGPLYSRSYSSTNFGPEVAELEAVQAGLAQSLADLGPESPPTS